MNRVFRHIDPVTAAILLVLAMGAVGLALTGILVERVDAREPCYRPEMMGTQCPRPAPLTPAYCPFP